MEFIPYLLGVDSLDENIIKGFNILKRKEDPTFISIKYRHEISSRSELRADRLWSRLVPKEIEGMSLFKPRYAMIPLEMSPYVVIEEYDGSEKYYIDYNKYGIKKIQEIIGDINQTNKLSAIQEVIYKVIRGNVCQ